MSLLQLIDDSALSSWIEKYLNEFDLFALKCALNIVDDELYEFLLKRTLIKPLAYTDYGTIAIGAITSSITNYPINTANYTIYPMGASSIATGEGNIIGFDSFASTNGTEASWQTSSPATTIIIGTGSFVSEKKKDFAVGNLKYEWEEHSNVIITGYSTNVRTHKYSRLMNINIMGNNNSIIAKPLTGAMNVNIVGNCLTVIFTNNKIHKDISIIDNNKTIIL